MMLPVRRGLELITSPSASVKREDFSKGKFATWFLCQIPLLLVLTWSGYLDPAEGFSRDALSILQYLGSAGLLLGFSMLLAVAKSFLVLWAGGVRMDLLASARELLPLHCILILLEAVITLFLLILYRLGGGIAYTMLEQIFLFGQELLFALGVFAVLYWRENVLLRRSILVSIGYFLAASAWLLLPFFA